ncbi:CRISPR/Cas system-associated protein Csn2, type II-A [Campylobacter blaseri]|uniref:Type II-A CRISPR-associated protein Csn2 n=1 Tax=Campylobacter blaseri TaxID=2042961 RepID=A0A2P8R3D1_9BACT|nr:type II-A CRISPR-associated protein Csn2 [Campylobacter blaseri]PSM53007.1 type II-A CRISPR-associated protein Csn2 [Campylobacter blaseri]PSM54474.1 type II-A CRISPR-associated protein Csn2 [Campylobacter blaseri]QKF85282.1 CRISPR/Cas system-associated protein Csn2, type II-A [Campylobacter blaseri]
MKIYHEILSKPIQFNENKVQILYIEKPEIYREILKDFNYGSGFIISDDNDNFEYDKTLSFNPDVLDLFKNERKIITQIQKNIIKDCQTKFYENSLSLVNKLNDFSNMILSSYDSIFRADISIENLVKILNIQIIQSDTLLENIVDFMNIEREVLDIKIFVFVNLKSIFSNNELLELYREIILRKFNVLLLESNYKIKLENEEIVIIDEDLCEVRC